MSMYIELRLSRRIEGELPDERLEIEEYSHFGMVARYTAGGTLDSSQAQPVAVSDNTTTYYTAKATDGAGNQSP